MRYRFFTGFACVALACAQQTTSGDNLFSLEKEAAMGNGLAKEFERTHAILADDVLDTYLAKLAARLNQFAQSSFPLSVRITSKWADY